MQTADADEIMVPLRIIIICAGLHQLRGQVVRRRFSVRPWIHRRSTFGASMKELSNEGQKVSISQSFSILDFLAILCLPCFFHRIIYKHKRMCHDSIPWIFIGHMSVSHWDLGKVVAIKLYPKHELDATPKSFNLGYTVNHDTSFMLYTTKLHCVA